MRRGPSASPLEARSKAGAVGSPSDLLAANRLGELPASYVSPTKEILDLPIGDTLIPRSSSGSIEPVENRVLDVPIHGPSGIGD